ncbi:MAG: hypothetical protein NVS9B8_18800 [Candidatus Limnocylindrales bacterium]
MDYSQRSLRAKMRSADRLGARWALLFDPDEARRRVARMRDLVTGEQIEVPWSELAERLAAPA